MCDLGEQLKCLSENKSGHGEAKEGMGHMGGANIAAFDEAMLGGAMLVGGANVMKIEQGDA